MSKGERAGLVFAESPGKPQASGSFGISGHGVEIKGAGGDQPTTS
jgi:hypothetical protein